MASPWTSILKLFLLKRWVAVDIWLYIMIFVDIWWWHFIFFDVFWLYLLIFDDDISCFWWYLMIFVDIWWYVLIVDDDVSFVLMFLMMFDNIWRYLFLFLGNLSPLAVDSPSQEQEFLSTQFQGKFQGPPIMGPLYGKRDPYYSQIFRDSYGSGMGIVWVRGPIIGGPWNSASHRFLSTEHGWNRRLCNNFREHVNPK